MAILFKDVFSMHLPRNISIEDNSSSSRLSKFFVAAVLQIGWGSKSCLLGDTERKKNYSEKVSREVLLHFNASTIGPVNTLRIRSRHLQAQEKKFRRRERRGFQTPNIFHKMKISAKYSVNTSSLNLLSLSKLFCPY